MQYLREYLEMKTFLRICKSARSDWNEKPLLKSNNRDDSIVTRFNLKVQLRPIKSAIEITKKKLRMTTTVSIIAII